MRDGEWRGRVAVEIAVTLREASRAELLACGLVTAACKALSQLIGLREANARAVRVLLQRETAPLPH